jgi:truncated hemoglobin YjbI
MTRARWWSTLVLAVGLILATWAGVSRAADPSAALDSAAVDKLVYGNLKDIINTGADMYNAGDWAGCYRLYEGALMGVRPFLGHRPSLQKAIDDARVAAERDNVVYRRAFILREVIDKVRAETRTQLTKKPPEDKPMDKPADKPVDKPVDKPADKPADKPGDKAVDKPLFEKLGGRAVVATVVHEVFDAALADKRVNFDRGMKLSDEKRKKLEDSIVDYISWKTGGPAAYTGGSMANVHKGMKITDAEFTAFMDDVKKVLDKNKVPASEQTALLEELGKTRKDIVEVPKTGGK